MQRRFSYDPAKARSNVRKHGVSFEEAKTVFLDPLAMTVFDEAHSEDEGRETTIGISRHARMLVVVHTEIVHDEVRIISARKANAHEAAQYPQG